MKSQATIRRHKKALRALIEDPTSDDVLRRIAYAMETALWWASQKTVGWQPMADEARLLASLLRKELGREA